MIEWLWVVINTVSLVVSVQSFREARRAQLAVAQLNGRAREIVAEAGVRREALRVGISLILLAIVVPLLFDDRETMLNFFVVALVSVALLLMVNAVSDARARRMLMAILWDEIEARRA